MSSLRRGSLHAFGKLSAAIFASEYPNIMACYGTSSSRDAAKAFDAILFPPSLRRLHGFLTMGQSLPPSALGWTDQDLIALCDDDFAQACDGEIRLVSMRILSHFGTLLAVGERRPSSQAYYGDDTLAISRHVQLVRPGTKHLDLCGGVGTHALHSSRLGAVAISADVNAKLARFQQINLALNPDMMVSFRHGDLFQPVGGETFDLITANPPLVPVPMGASIGLPSDGGETGLRLTERIVSDAPKHMNVGGKLIVQGLSFGDADGPGIHELTRSARSQGLSVMLILLYQEEIDPVGPMLESLVSTSHITGQSRAELLDLHLGFAHRHGWSRLYSWQLVATKDGRAENQIVAFSKRNSRLWEC